MLTLHIHLTSSADLSGFIGFCIYFHHFFKLVKQSFSAKKAYFSNVAVVGALFKCVNCQPVSLVIVVLRMSRSVTFYL